MIYSCQWQQLTDVKTPFETQTSFHLSNISVFSIKYRVINMKGTHTSLVKFLHNWEIETQQLFYFYKYNMD